MQINSGERFRELMDCIFWQFGKSNYLYFMATPIIPIEEVNRRKPAECILTAKEYAGNHVSKSGKTRRKVSCVCECGNTHICVVADLIRGNHLSCGCLPRGRKEITKHRRLYHIWAGLFVRCNDKKNKYYGGKGVQVCEEWKDYLTFEAWALANGYDDTKQIDKDIKGNGLIYGPDACAWVTPLQNSIHRSASKKFDFNGKRLTLSQIAIETNLPYPLLKGRVVGLKWDLHKAINTPKHGRAS